MNLCRGDLGLPLYFCCANQNNIDIIKKLMYNNHCNEDNPDSNNILEDDMTKYEYLTKFLICTFKHKGIGIKDGVFNDNSNCFYKKGKKAFLLIK